MQSKNILHIALGTVFILAIPLVAMQFSEEVKWGLFDFLAIGILLMGAGLLYEFAASKKPQHRLTIGVLAVFAVLLIWAQLAVGIFGD